MEILSTSNINKLINSSKQSEYYNRVQPLVDRKNNFSQLSSTWSSLKTSLDSFKSLLSDLKDVQAGGTFTEKIAQLSAEDYFEATAVSKASLSSYDIRVNQLAKFDRVMSDTVTSADVSGLSSGTYTFTVTSGETTEDISIDVAGTETKEELMQLISDGINNAMEDAVSASVFSPTDDTAKLSLVSSDTGEANAITLQDKTGNALAAIGMNFTSRTLLTGDGSSGGYSNTLEGLNAKINLNGVDVERSSNTIDDLINGVTLQLKNAMEEGIPTVNLMVKNNVESFKADIQDFIQKFNDSYQFVKSKYFADSDGQRGIFVGDATAQGLMSKFSQISYQQVEGVEEGNYSFLSEIGIEFDTAKGLKIADDDKLTEALESNPDQVASLFNSENGIANKLYDVVDSYVKSDGVISSLIDTYDKSVSYLSDKITSKETQIDKNASVLRKQYEAMQVQLLELQEMQSAFQLAGIG